MDHQSAHLHPQTLQLTPEEQNSPVFNQGGPDVDSGISSQQLFASQSSVKQDDSAPPIGMFQCAFCKKCYNRADHLQRHVRSHSGEKPYACNICMKTFGRPDLLKRHAEGHLTEREDGAKRRKLNQVAQTNRVSQACKVCSASKLKCDEKKPCTRCSTRGFICEPLHPPTGLPEEAQEPKPSMSQPSSMSQQPFMSTPLKLEDQLPTPGSADQIPIVLDMHENIIESDYGFYPDIFGIDWSLGRSLRVAADYVEQGIGVPTLSLSSAGGQVPREPYDWNSYNFNPETFRASVQQATGCFDDGVAGPAREDDNAYKEEVKLALPPILPIKARRKPQSQVLKENLDYTARDRVLNLVIKNVQKENVEKIVRSFPATELYDDFMQHFFNNFTRRVDDWIHAPTFRPNAAAAELLTPIIAAGAIYQDQYVLRTIGYAMIEQARLAIPKTIDMHNTSVRDPEIHQAYLLQIESRQYCASMWKVEVAEALFSAGVAMLRRNRQFRRWAYTTFSLNLDEKETLDDRWRKWAKQEERKRTAFRAFCADAAWAIMVNTTPLAHFSEMSLPLPDTEALWRARSAQEWAAIQMSRGQAPSRLPSLLDCIRDMSQLVTYAPFLDVNYSVFIILSSLWTFICQHRQMRSLQPRPNWRNPAADSTAYPNCLKILNDLQAAIYQLPPLRADVMMMQSFVSMSLQVTIDEEHLFAGKSDREEAIRAYHSAQQWIESPSSRQALYHAGQVIRWARALPPLMLRDLYGNILWHTCMVLWCYGVLSRARSHLQAAHKPYYDNNFLVLLDNDDTMNPATAAEVQSFIQDMSGAPCIRHYRINVVLVEDPTSVMEEIGQLLNANWGQGPPEFVKGIRRLIADLGAAAKMKSG